MGCRTTALPGGGIIWICGRVMDNAPVCRVCGHLSTKLCDYPVGKGKTCDSALCDQCSLSIGGDIDYCQEHAAEYSQHVANADSGEFMAALVKKLSAENKALAGKLEKASKG